MKIKGEVADIIYKILLLGESNVGKTSIILRYIDNTFDDSTIATCGIDFKCKYVSCDNKKIRLEIWDTAGQERFRGLTKNYFHGAHGFILVYDITNKESFNKLKNWINDVKEKMREEGSFRIAIVGNKKDCENDREVDFDKLKNFGENNNVFFSEISAKTGEGVDNLFIDFINELMKYRNIGIYKNDENFERTYSSLERSLVPENKHECNC